MVHAMVLVLQQKLTAGHKYSWNGKLAIFFCVLKIICDFVHRQIIDSFGQKCEKDFSEYPKALRKQSSKFFQVSS